MTIDIRWDDEAQTILRLNFERSWTVDDFNRMIHRAFAIVRMVAHPVYVIADLRRIDDWPVGIAWGMYDSDRIRPPNWKGVIMITDDIRPDSVTIAIADAHQTMTGRQLRIVHTEAEAYDQVQQLLRAMNDDARPPETQPPD